MSVTPINLVKQDFDTEQAALLSTKLDYNQTIFLRNLLSDIAEEKMNLAVDPANPAAYAFHSEFLRGQLTVLQHILGLAAMHTS